jgi:hypothetical protein
MFTVGSLYKDMLPKQAAPSSKVLLTLTNGNTTSVGTIIDTLGYNRVLWIFFTGTVTDGDYSWKIYHGDESDMSDEVEATVALKNLNGSPPSWTEDTDDDKIVSCEYICTKRYVRAKCTQANGSSGATVGAIAVLANPNHAPVQT